MKTPVQITADVERRLRNTWNSNLDSATGDHWPQTFPIGTVAKAELERDFEQYRTSSLTWRTWAAQPGVTLTDTARLVLGTTQRIPTHITVDNADTAARLCGPTWTSRLHRGRARLNTLRQHKFSGDLTRVVQDVDTYNDVDFDLLCATADWFRDHAESARGLTPRQVPVPGLHAKWLNSRHATIATLAGLPDLGLLPRHPPRIHFTYLDPEHRATGGRWHDSASVGDTMSPVYEPRVVIITENKDTAIGFPPLRSGISVEGAGTGGSTPAAIEWLRTCPMIVYWGDMDVDGFAILNGYRAAGISARSILMDVATYDAYAKFGTNTDAKGDHIKIAVRRNLTHLTESERALYDRLTDPCWNGYRRLEQERIPLSVAVAEAVKLIDKASTLRLWSTHCAVKRSLGSPSVVRPRKPS